MLWKSKDFWRRRVERRKVEKEERMTKRKLERNERTFLNFPPLKIIKFAVESKVPELLNFTGICNVACAPTVLDEFAYNSEAIPRHFRANPTLSLSERDFLLSWCKCAWKCDFAQSTPHHAPATNANNFLLQFLNEALKNSCDSLFISFSFVFSSSF